MNLSRLDRSLLAWVLYFSVLFSAFACSIGHGQLSGLQLSGMDGGYCALGASGGPAMAAGGATDAGLPMASTGPGCPLCSTFGALVLAAFFGLLGLLPRRPSPNPLPWIEAGRAPRYLWPSANPRASPLIA